MSSGGGEESLSFAQKLVDEAFDAAFSEEDSSAKAADCNLIKAVIKPKFEHIHCESLHVEPKEREHNANMDEGDMKADKTMTNPEGGVDGEDKRFTGEQDDVCHQEDGESGTNIPQDDSWEELHVLKQDSADEPSVKDSTSLDRAFIQDAESINGVDDDPAHEVTNIADEGDQDVSPGSDGQEDGKKIAKKEKGFFSNMFKRKPKPNSVKDTASSAKEQKSGLDKKKSRSSLFLFGSNSDLTTAGKTEQASPESGEPRTPGKDSKASTPQTEFPTKGFFSFGAARKRKTKKAESSHESDTEALSPGEVVSGNQDPSEKSGDICANEKVYKHTVVEGDGVVVQDDGFDDGDDNDVLMNVGDESVDDVLDEKMVNESSVDGEYDNVDIGEVQRSPEGDAVSLASHSEYRPKHRMFSIPQYFKKVSKIGDSAKKLKTQIWSSVVTIVLIEGKKLLPMDDNGYSDPYVKFRLGNERYKSKYKTKTLNPKWLEQFDLHMFDDQTSHLEIAVYDHDTGGRDDIMGRAEIDLSTLDPEVTHALDVPLEDGAGIIRLLLSISGTSGSETVSDLANYVPDPKEREMIIRRYGFLRSFKGFRDIGWLQVKVIKAQGLAAADIGGKSDPFCVLELVNTRLQTQTEYKTLNPEWGKVFTLNIKDIHSILEVTVYDEDRDKKCEFLGKVSIPLLRVRPGERRWYQLKDRKLMCRARGAIQLEMDIVFNNFKAAIRTFNPREDKYMQPDPKFKLSAMKRNIDRVKKIAQSGVEAGKFLQSCFDWESKVRSTLAFAVFLIIVWNFELYMLPLTLLIIFVKNLLIVHIVGNLMKDKEDDEYVDEEDDDDEDDKETKAAKKEEKKSFKEKMQAIQDVSLQVQEGMDMVASLGERVKNTFNWTVPWLSWLAVIILTIGVIVLYFVPLRYLIMAWGINKFTKKLRNPNAIPNNELLDFLSRVPSDKELIMYRELRPDPSTGVAKRKRN